MYMNASGCRDVRDLDFFNSRTHRHPEDLYAVRAKWGNRGNSVRISHPDLHVVFASKTLDLQD